MNSHLLLTQFTVFKPISDSSSIIPLSKGKPLSRISLRYYSLYSNKPASFSLCIPFLLMPSRLPLSINCTGDTNPFFNAYYLQNNICFLPPPQYVSSPDGGGVGEEWMNKSWLCDLPETWGWEIAISRDCCFNSSSLGVIFLGPSLFFTFRAPWEVIKLSSCLGHEASKMEKGVMWTVFSCYPKGWCLIVALKTKWGKGKDLNLLLFPRENDKKKIKTFQSES